ncbi:MAG: class I SAM-dependent methyltransferase [Leptospiraceae bacterium]|nr:class I SAM-dependent methyltransferase [Leptospiraceae bacterium]
MSQPDPLQTVEQERSSDQPLVREVRPTFFERLFYYGLRHCQHGTLRLHYQNSGVERSIGDGSAHSGTIVVHDQRFFKHVVLYGEIGFGEAWFMGWWDSENLHSVLTWFVNNSQTMPGFSSARLKTIVINSLTFINRIGHLLRPNSKKQARDNIARHYDLSNSFFELMLDDSMTYSAGVFLQDNDSLAQAQFNKYRLLCQKLDLQPGDHLLEIGSGWGGMAMHAAYHFGCKVTTVTISKEQYHFARRRIEVAGLQDQIEIRLQDYRDIKGQYDKIVSIEMLEAVGHKYFPVFFRKCQELLNPDGLLALQCITFPDSDYRHYLQNVDFIQKHIFPGGELAATSAVLEAVKKTGDLVLQDLESIGQHYAKTLWLWQQRFQKNSSRIMQLGFDERFVRMWYYYLVYCEIGFAANYINTVQLLFAHPQNSRMHNFHSPNRSFAHV